MSTKFRTVQSIAPFVAGWFFMFRFERPDAGTSDENFIICARSEYPDAAHIVGYGNEVYCFVPTAIALDDINTILKYSAILPGSARVMYLASTSTFNDMLRTREANAAKDTDADKKCFCGLCRKPSAAGDAQEDLETLKKVSSAAMRAIDVIPRNEKTKPIVIGLLLDVMSDADNLSIDTFRKFRSDLVGAIGEEAVAAAGFPPID